MRAEQQHSSTEIRKVWDLPTRLFHWALAALVATGWYFGEFGPFIKTWHFYCGYAIGVLLLARIMWGFVGNRAARFSGFIYGPGAFVAYARRLFRRSPSHWPGHNPMGGWSVIALLVLLCVQVGTGLFTDDDIANAGPLTPYVSGTLSARLTAIHHLNSKLILGLVILHVGMIVFYRLWKRENLVHPMITGWKTVKRGPPEDAG